MELYNNDLDFQESNYIATTSAYAWLYDDALWGYKLPIRLFRAPQRAQ